MRIARLDPATAAGDQLKALNSAVGGMALFGVLAHAGSTVLPVMRLGGAVLGAQKLDARSRELMVLVALHLTGGSYEWAQHVDIAAHSGVSAQQIAAIAALDFNTLFDARDHALLAFAKSVVEEIKVPDPIFAAARVWLDEQETVEALVAMGFYMMLARFTAALEIEPDPVQGAALEAGVDRRPVLNR